MKKTALIILVLMMLFPMQAIGGTTLTENSTDRPGFVNSLNSTDLSGCETLVTAVTGKSIYVERVYIISGAAINLTIGAGETANAVTATVLGPIYVAANSSTVLVFTKPIAITAATALTIDASGSGNVTVIVQGYIK